MNILFDYLPFDATPVAGDEREFRMLKNVFGNNGFPTISEGCNFDWLVIVILPSQRTSVIDIEEVEKLITKHCPQGTLGKQISIIGKRFMPVEEGSVGRQVTFYISLENFFCYSTDDFTEQ